MSSGRTTLGASAGVEPETDRRRQFGELTSEARCFAVPSRRRWPCLTEADKIEEWIQVNTLRAEMLILAGSDAYKRQVPAPAACAHASYLCTLISQAHEFLATLGRSQ